MYSIGQFAKKTGVTVRALRYYDELGLLKPSHISQSGRRYYNDEDLVILQNIVTFKLLGYSLEHIQEVLASTGGDLQKSLQRQKLELQLKKEQLEKTLATLDHALTLTEKKQNIDTSIFLSLIHSALIQDEQKQYLKTVLPEPLVNELFDVTPEELVEHSIHFMEYAEKLRNAFVRKLDDAEVFPLIEQMFSIVPTDLIERTIESSSHLTDETGLDDSLFPSPFTKQEEEWIVSLIEKMELFGGRKDNDEK